MQNPLTIDDISPCSDIYMTSRGQIEHFENATNVRIIWLSIGQSFFFGVFVTLISIKAPDPGMLRMQHMLTAILPAAAFLNALVTLFDVAANLNYMKMIRLNYEELAKDVSSDQFYPHIWGEDRDRIFQHASPVINPLIFLVSWLVIMLFTYHIV